MESTSGVEIITNVLPALALVVGAPVAIWWWSRRTRSSATHRLRVTDKAALGRNTWLAVVEVDDRRLLVGAGESGVEMLTELEQLEEVDLTDLGPVEGISTEDTTNGIIERPRTGLVRRLQDMTLRSPTTPSRRPFDASRR